MIPSDHQDKGGAARALRKWGPFAVICAALLFIGAAVVLDDGANTVAADGPSEAEGADNDGPGAPEPTGAMPITYNEAVEAGTQDDYEWGDRCDTSTGRMKLPTEYAPPCVPVFIGDNGGAQGHGVTEDKITLVWYRIDEGLDINSLLSSAGIDETPEDQYANMLEWVELFGSMAETYGREVELVRVDSSGPFDDAVASRADAERISSDIKPFAVIGGPPSDGGAFAKELARNDIICIGCSIALSECIIQDIAPHAWGTQGSGVQYISVLLAWLGQADEGSGLTGNAVYAGDPDLAAKQRRAGVIHYEQDPPVMGTCLDPDWGADEVVTEPYVLDLAALPQIAVEIMAKMKSQGVTTIVFLGDPLMPIYLTKAAQNIDYHPEWVFTGTVLTDTNIFGRQYDQSQMAHAFGVSQVGVKIDEEDPASVKSLFKWYFGADAEPAAPSQYAVLAASIADLMLGITMAGPELTPATYERGLFRVPPMGGTALAPLTSYGDWGFYPEPDYNGTDDLAEIWWDPDLEGVDEIGVVGKGMWRYAHNGERFTNQDPLTPRPFDPEDTVTEFSEIPDAERPPTYPPPPGSPAA